jgi:hypothetical protein
MTPSPKCPRCGMPVDLSPGVGNIGPHRDAAEEPCWAAGRRPDEVERAMERERAALAWLR